MIKWSLLDYKAIVPALSIDKASSWPFNEVGDMRSHLLSDDITGCRITTVNICSVGECWL